MTYTYEMVQAAKKSETKKGLRLSTRWQLLFEGYFHLIEQYSELYKQESKLVEQLLTLEEENSKLVATEESLCAWKSHLKKEKRKLDKKCSKLKRDLVNWSVESGFFSGEDLSDQEIYGEEEIDEPFGFLFPIEEVDEPQGEHMQDVSHA
jgi:hypothetical protein